MEDFLLPCLNKQLFGMDCLGCGAQRSLVLLLHGEFAAALKMYPAIYTLLLLAIFLVVNLFVKFKNDWFVKAGLIILNAGIIITAYAYKMSFFIN